MRTLDGSLGLALFEDRYVQDPYPLYALMHRSGAVHRIGESDFYAVSSWAAVEEAVTRCDEFSSNLTATMMYRPDGSVDEFHIGEIGGPTQALATADEPAHSAHRKMLLPHLAAKRIAAFEPYIDQTAHSLWGNAFRGSGIEWMAGIANRLPMMIVARIIGVPDRDVDRLIRWGYAATQVVEGLVTDDQMAQAGTAVMELAAYITEQFENALSDPGDDLIGDLATARARSEMSDTTALAMMATLFSAGGESTASLLGSAAWLLATRSDIQQQVRETPELLGPFIEEVLRFEPPFRAHYRHVVVDTELCGVALPADSRLLLLWGAANRDPDHFDEPDRLLLDRPRGKGHVAFGKGVHFCVGAALARMEARVVLRFLLHETRSFTASRRGRWLPSLLVRRLDHLDLAVE
ncbi:cytochrome P450 [Mycolicibacterium flavescens]|uniref:Cytochrome n=1 Tax=Mycolicibacterium flavescens TaxID=1776 RepID=A0A1E3RRL8_MYCFV|nr:cytochrome P450 [Mycolicibacterium flavescens]MCV7279347.1 cytochrome P450 [Mycolicibacterium flavescens]ODQ92037.1 cytochrome [Mycolicibacterium flavescens]